MQKQYFHVSNYSYRACWRASGQASVTHAKVAHCDTVEFILCHAYISFLHN